MLNHFFIFLYFAISVHFTIYEMLKIFKNKLYEEKTFCQFGFLFDFCTPFSKKNVIFIFENKRF